MSGPLSNFFPPEPVREVLNVLVQMDREPWIVGGTVRDLLLGTEPRDWDLSFRGIPEDLERLAGRFGAVRSRGIPLGSLGLKNQGIPVDVTLFRREGDYRDGRRPGRVDFRADLDEDLMRRDYTLNALALSWPERVLRDHWEEQPRLEKDTYEIRTCRPAVESFREDPLRMLRGFVLWERLAASGRTPVFSREIVVAFEECGMLAAAIARDTAGRELDKLAGTSRGGSALKAMERAGVLGAAGYAPDRETVSWEKLDSTPDARVFYVALRHLTGLMPFRGSRGAVLTVAQALDGLPESPEELKGMLCHLGFREGELYRKTLRHLYPDRYAYYGAGGAFREPLYLRDLAVTGRDLGDAGIGEGPLRSKILMDLLYRVHRDPDLNRKDLLLSIVRSSMGDNGRNQD